MQDNLFCILNVYFLFHRNLKLEFRKYKEKTASTALIHMSKIQSDNDDDFSVSSHSTTKNESKTRDLMPMSTFMGTDQDYKSITENMQPADTGNIETISNSSNETGTEVYETIPDDKKFVRAKNELGITVRDQEQFQEGLSPENLLTYYHGILASSSYIPPSGQRIYFHFASKETCKIYQFFFHTTSDNRGISNTTAK